MSLLATPSTTCEYTGNQNLEASPEQGNLSSASLSKQKTFRLANLFIEEDQVKLSHLDISEILDIAERSSKRNVVWDVENGYITKTRTTYKSPKYRTLLDGKNILTLTEKGRQYLNRGNDNPESPPSSNNSSKEEYIAKSSGREGSSYKLNHEDQQLLQKYGFTKLIPTAPKWWFKDTYLAEKCLKLLKRKKARGYKCHCDLKWLSSAIKREGVSFRRKVADVFRTLKSRHSET